jgi:3-deoxy-D-manno-octulosonic acid (KDO) 8-phosphate synthase
LLAGPNVIESEEHVMKMAKHIKAITTKWATDHHTFVYSWDKLNLLFSPYQTWGASCVQIKLW